MNMVRSIIRNSSLPKLLWMYVLKTTIYLLNRGLSKAVSKILFELWTGKKSNLHLHIRGCLAKAKIYNSHERKLDYRMISGYFIGFPKKSKGYRFYYLNHNPIIVETGTTRFIKIVKSVGVMNDTI